MVFYLVDELASYKWTSKQVGELVGVSHFSPFHLFTLSPFLRLILVRKRHEIRDEECGNGGHEGEDKEVFVSQPVAKESTSHSWQHHTEVHNARSEGVVCHLVFAWRYLLHHEKG